MNSDFFAALYRRHYNPQHINDVDIFEGYLSDRKMSYNRFICLVKEKQRKKIEKGEKGKKINYIPCSEIDHDGGEICTKYILVFSYFTHLNVKGEACGQIRSAFQFEYTDVLSDEYLDNLRQRYPGIQVDSTWRKKPRTEDDDKFLFEVEASPLWLEKVFLNPNYQKGPGDERFESVSVLSFGTPIVKRKATNKNPSPSEKKLSSYNGVAQDISKVKPIQKQTPEDWINNIFKSIQIPQSVQELKDPQSVQELKVLEEGEVQKPIPEQAPEDFTIEDFPAEKRLLLVLKGQKYTFKGDTRFSTMSTFLDIKTKP